MVLVIFFFGVGSGGGGDKSLARISIMKRTLGIFLRFFFNHLHSFLIHFFLSGPSFEDLEFFCIAPRHIVCNQMVAVPVPRQLLKYLTTWTVKGALQLYNVTIKLQKLQHWLRLINKYKREASLLIFFDTDRSVELLDPTLRQKTKRCFRLSNYID